MWSAVDSSTGLFQAPRAVEEGSAPVGKAMVEEILDKAAAAGLNTVRFFAQTVNGRAFQTITGPNSYSEVSLAAFDWLVAASFSRGLRVIVVLVDFWQNQGGIRDILGYCGVQVSWSDDTPVNLDPASGQFFSRAECKTAYKAWARKLITRASPLGVTYANHPGILAWELINEPRYKATWPGPGLPSWIHEMATFLKGDLQVKQLVSTGEEGFFSAASGRSDDNPNSARYGRWGEEMGQDFISDHSSTAIDFGSTHSWPDNWSMVEDDENPTADGAAFTASFIESHARAARESLGKPCIVEEHGKRAPADDGSATIFVERERYLAAAFAAIERTGMAGSLFWHVCGTGVTYGLPAFCIWPQEEGEGPHAGAWTLVKNHVAAMKQLAAATHAISISDSLC